MTSAKKLGDVFFYVIYINCMYYHWSWNMYFMPCQTWNMRKSTSTRTLQN